MTEREQQIMELLRQDPMLSQGELAKRLGITRSSVAVHLANLGKKGCILGKGYMLADQEPRYVVGIGAANIDLMGRSRDAIILEDSNPGSIGMSVGGVTHNICENAARMGVPVRLITVTGDDVYGEKIRRECQAAGIDTANFMTCEGESSSIYLSIHDTNGEMAVAMSDMGVLQKLSVEFLRGRNSVIRGAGAIVMDTGLPQEVLDYVLATYGGEIPIFVDPVSTTYSRKLVGKLRGCHTLKPNLLETEILAGMSIKTPEELDAAAKKLISQGLRRIVVSLGKQGAYYRDDTGLAFRAATKPLEQVVNATGAGDAFLGGLVYSYMNDLSPRETMNFAMAAALMAISHQNTINPNISADNIRAVIRRTGLEVAEK